MHGERLEEAFRGYRDLPIWQRGVELTARRYRFTLAFPKDEIFGLTSKTRRASISIPANIAESLGRNSTASFVQFCEVANGSQTEPETHPILSGRTRLGATKEAEGLRAECEEIGRMLRTFINRLKRESASGSSLGN